MTPSSKKDRDLETWLADHVSPATRSTSLSDATAGRVIERLKQEADRYWSIDPNCSLEYADRIFDIGHARKDKSQMALGLMARGDALKVLGQLEAAWKKLDESGKMFEEDRNEVGWARTRIGRLALGPDLKRVTEVLADVERAHAIFQAWGEHEKLIRLELNTAYNYTELGDQRQALQLYYSALALAEALGVAGEPHLGMLNMNIGYVHESLGDFPTALIYYEKARSQYLERDEPLNIINVDKNIACIIQAQGRYRSALRALNDILARGSKQSPREHERVRHSLAECYLSLNRYQEARDLARQVLESYRSFGDSYYSARALLHLAEAEFRLGNLTSAQSALAESELIFTDLGSLTWGMFARLLHGQIAFKQGSYELAWKEAQAAAECFEGQGQQVKYATACILMGQVSQALGDLASANIYGHHALQIAQHDQMPLLRYQAHLLLGQVANSRSLTMRATRHYRAATATIDRVQRGLTITLRSGFLEDKGEAWRELIRLYVGLGQLDCAFDALEQSKSQVLLNYLNNREQFHWSREDSQTQALIDELERLRAEHHSYYHLAFNPPLEQPSLNFSRPEEARSEVAVRERRIRTITEKLYLLSYSDNTNPSPRSSFLSEIQAAIDERTMLIEFYDDGQQYWAFVLDGQSCEVQSLTVNADTLNVLLRELNANIDTALSLEPGSAFIERLTILAQGLLQHLYSLLLEPLGIQRRGRERITIVPYGVLHYLPFHLLHDGAAYLIENYEVVTLPAASLLTRSSPRRSSGALILSHSWGGRLPFTLREAQIVQSVFGGVLYAETAATRAALQTEPSQILHIATHGQHRLDQPDLSFLELADGQLYADDLLQQDMSYELVTLSACQTGQVNVAADEELIGIGRGLLYAGAGALILSLWQVADTTTTLTLMEHLYGALYAGSSKAAALREAQLYILQQDRQLHPALWGAFQLIGDAKPLSKVNDFHERN